VSLEPEFLTVEDVVELHRDVLEAFGGADGIRDAGALEAAVMMPQQSMFGEWLHEDLFAMAAAYAFHLAEAQAFLDGNKRVGLYAATTFLELNGAAVEDPEDRLYDAMIAIAEHRLDKAGLSDLLRVLPRAAAEESP
jgi:death-on-curing protein